MNRAEHKAQAEEGLAAVEQIEREAEARGGMSSVDFQRFAAERAAILAKAQVHATLALYPDPMTVKYV